MLRDQFNLNIGIKIGSKGIDLVAVQLLSRHIAELLCPASFIYTHISVRACGRAGVRACGRASVRACERGQK